MLAKLNVLNVLKELSQLFMLRFAPLVRLALISLTLDKPPVQAVQLANTMKKLDPTHATVVRILIVL